MPSLSLIAQLFTAIEFGSPEAAVDALNACKNPAELQSALLELQSVGQQSQDIDLAILMTEFRLNELLESQAQSSHAGTEGDSP